MSDRRSSTTRLPDGNSGESPMGDPLFEMPPFPPWDPTGNKTVSERSLSTPLRRRTRRTLKVSDESNITSYDTSNDTTSSGKKYDDTVYNYHPFTDKTMISDTKIKNFLAAERAEHCLVFHKNGHLDGMEHYRPDISIDCEQDTSSGNDILINYPGNIKDIFKESESKLNNRQPREFEKRLHARNNKPATKLLELKTFWENSDLLNYLDTDIIIKQNEILLRELDELVTAKNLLRHKNDSDSLRERCDKILKKHSHGKRNY